MPQGVEQCQPNRYAKRTLHCNCLFTELTWLIHCALLRLPSSGWPHSLSPLSPSALPLRALVIVTPSTIADKSFAIWLHFAFGIFPLRLPLACATNFERNMSSKVSLSVALSVSPSACPSIYLYLVYLAGSLSVTQPSLSPCLSIGFSAASISQPQQRMYLPHCVSRYLSLCPNCCCCCYSQCSWPFFTLHLSQSPPPSSETTPANLRLPPLQSYALLVLVCRRRVPQIAACVRCSKQTNKNQNTKNNNKNNKHQQQMTATTSRTGFIQKI